MQEQSRLQKIVLTFARHNWPVILIITAVFGAGIFFGALGVNTLSSASVEQLTGVVDRLIAGAPDMEVSTSAVSVKEALTDNLVIWAVIFFLGLTVIGIPMILVLVFMRGFTLGFVISFLARQKSTAGALLAASSVMPHNILFIPALFVSSVAAHSFSIILLKRFFDNRVPVGPAFLGYGAVMLGSCIIFSGAAFLESYITPWLTRMVSSMINGGWSLPI